MENKKSKQANLENKKGIFVQVGLVVALSIVLISFEWTSAPQVMDDISMVNEIDYEDDMIYVPRDEPKEEEIKPEPPKVIEVIEIVEDDEETIEWIFDTEVDKDTKFDFSRYIDEDEIIVEPEIFIKVETMPTFNGGEATREFWKYIGENLVYPEIAAQNGIMGKVIVQFTVNSEGKVVNATIIRAVDPALDKEALRVVMSSPKWSPGLQRGKPVNVLFSFPINFVLQ